LTAFSLLDWLALAFFGLGWARYQLAAERTTGRRQSLNVLMNQQRYHWIEQMVRRIVYGLRCHTVDGLFDYAGKRIVAPHNGHIVITARHNPVEPIV